MSTGLMAKYIAQIVATGVQIVGRAFARALQQEIRASQQAAKARSSQTGTSADTGAASDVIAGMSVQEAKQILNLDNHKDFEALQTKYEHLFNVNEKTKGGSFYIQSKVFRAKERIDQDILDEEQTIKNKDSESKNT